jgi:fibro-slime domain-containing protein
MKNMPRRRNAPHTTTRLARKGTAVLLALVAVAIATMIGLAVSSARDAATMASDQIVRLTQSRLAARTALDVAAFTITNHPFVIAGAEGNMEQPLFAPLRIGESTLSATVRDAAMEWGPTRSTVAVRIDATASEQPGVAPDAARAPLAQTVSAIQRIPWPDAVARADIDLSEFALLASVAPAYPSAPPKVTIGAGAEVSVWRSAPIAVLGEPLVVGSSRRLAGDVSIHANARTHGVQTLSAGDFPASREDIEDQLADGIRTVPEDIHVPRLQVATGPGEDYASTTPMSHPYDSLNTWGKPNMSLRLPPGGEFSSLPLTFAGSLQPGQWRVVRLCGLEVTVRDCLWRFEVPTMLVVEGKLRLTNGTRFELGANGALTIVALDGVLVDRSYIGPALPEAGPWSTTGAQPYGGFGASRVTILEGGNPAGFRLTYGSLDLRYRPTGARMDRSGGTNPTILKDGTRIINGSAVVGEIYAPDSTVEVGSNCALYGRALANQITVSPGGRVFYDPQLDTGAGWLNPRSGIWDGSGSARPEVRAIALLNDECLARFSTSTGLAVGSVGNDMLMTADVGEAGFHKRDMNAIQFQSGSGNGSSPSGMGPAQGAPTPVGIPAADYEFPPTLRLWGTIRDFRGRLDSLGHLDFGLPNAPPNTNWTIGTRLDDDGKPVAAKPPALGMTSQRTIHSEASFATWFRDTPCQNLSRPRVLILHRAASYGHTPENPRWVYGVGGGSLGMSADRCYNDAYDFISGWNYGVNLSWTMEFGFSFVYRQDKSQWLHVSAGSDVWVYLDGKLLIDIGGRSKPTFGAVDLNSVAASLGLVDAQSYDLKIFIANRYRAAQPNFQIWLNFPFDESPMPEIVAFSRLGEIKRARGQNTDGLRAGSYATPPESAARARLHILGFTALRSDAGTTTAD